jgi:ubiquitin-conjugating enzyme E2 O
LSQLSVSDAQDRKRPARFWFGEDLATLTLVKYRPHHDMRVGEKVVLEDDFNVPTTRHGQPSDPTGVVVVKTLVVKQTRSSVDVLWQDGTRERLDSI